MKTRRIGVLTCDDAAQLDIVGPLEVFHEANEHFIERNKAAPYQIIVLYYGDEAPRSSWPASRYDRARELDTLLVASGHAKRHVGEKNEQLHAWLRATAQRVRRLGSFCTGAFILAAAGLLDGKRATTHWKRCAELAEKYPRVRVEPDPIFVRDGRVWSSAGSSAAMDLALALVEDDLGHDVALAVARELVLFLQRPGGQSQFSAQLTAQRAERRPLSELQAWMADHPGNDLSVEALAKRAAMSPRNFARVFRRELGVTPARYVELLRIDTARRRLQESSAGLEQVAVECGFGSAETLRRAFVRALGVSPSGYRGRFRARA